MLAIVLVKMAAEQFHRRMALPPPQRDHLRKVFLTLAVAAFNMRFHLIDAPGLLLRWESREEFPQKGRAVGPIGRLAILQSIVKIKQHSLNVMHLMLPPPEQNF